MYFRTLIPFCLLASVASAESFTLESATRRALENNPGLAATRELVAEAGARASGLGRLPAPELETELAAGRQGRARIEVGLSKTFPRASHLRLQRRFAADGQQLAASEVALATQRLTARVHAAVLELAAAQAALELAEKHAALARTFAWEQAAQVRTGQLASLDSAQADLAAREAELGLALPRASVRTAALQLAALLGTKLDDTPHAVFDFTLPPAEAAVPPAAPCAEAALVEARINVADADVALARSYGREDYKLGVFVEADQDRSDLGDREQEAMLGLRFSVPLASRNTAAPLVAEKQAARRRVALEREAYANESANAVAASAIELRVLHGTALALATELLPAARAHLAATETARSRGEVDPISVFRARERLAEIERSVLAARIAYHRVAVRRLSAACNLAH